MPSSSAEGVAFFLVPGRFHTLPEFARLELMYRLTTVLLAASVWILGADSLSWAQESPEPTEESTTDVTQQEVTIGLTPAGVQRQVAGRWATLAVNGTNRSSQDVEETSIVMVGDQSGLQYARRIWIPAGTRRQAWLPIQIPSDLYPEQVQIPMTSIHLKESDGGEGFQANSVGMPTSKRSLLLSWEDSRAAVILEQINPNPEALRLAEKLSKTIYAGRDATVPNTQDLGLAQLSGLFLPPTANPLDSLDQIVIANDRLLNDTVAVARLRAWLQLGGRIWIMADQLDPDSVQALLGDAVCYSVVDRVQLNDFELEQIGMPLANSNPTETWSSETPVEMVRVLIDTPDVHSRVDGWPAAFWMQVGQGEVLFTTLEAQGWLQGDEPTEALRSLSSRFFVKRLDPPQHTEELATYLSKEIGYQIPGRGVIATLLGAHILVVLVAGIWLARRHELQYMGYLIPAAAILATLSLVAVGNRQTTAVPSTIATGQIVHAVADSSQVQVESVAAIYSQETRPLPITSSAVSVTQLGDDQSSGEVKRILWDDSGKSEWLFVEQRQSKVQHAETNAIVNLPDAWSVRGRFTPNGLEGQIVGLDPGKCQDAVVVSSANPSLAIKLDPNSGTFVGGLNDVLLPDQFYDSTLISDVQQDRQALTRELHDSDATFFPRQPSLLFWTDPVDAGANFGDGFVRRGWALASVPLRIERLNPGSEFKVPASFLQLESHVGAKGPSTVFNPDTGRWLDSMNKPSESELRCVVPRPLLPCQLRRCQVVMKVTAPGRTVEVKGMVGGQYQTLYRVESPAGRVEFEINDPDALSLDAGGGFLISISVSETEQEKLDQQQPAEAGEEPTAAYAKISRSTWAIDYVHLNVEGTTL